ncbi:MAG: PEP-utilizing enzyme [Acidobacteriota bacterium]
MTAGRFPSPFEVAVPPGAEHWEELYPYYHVFSPERREYEEGKFWYQDSLHHPEPLYPFDAITAESWWVGLGQYNSRVFQLPTALGLDQRILCGYLYVSPNAVTDPDQIDARTRQFRERAGYYYEHWDELSARWVDKVRTVIDELQAVEVPVLPEIEDAEMVTGARGLTSAYYLLRAYDQLIDSMHKIWHYHFELLNLGYTAYLAFFEFCKKAFPDIPDQNIARMVSGIDVILFRPDDELKRLARLALSLGLAPLLLETTAPEELFRRMGQTDSGRRWASEFEESKHPWFNFSLGSGFDHTHGSWVDDLSVPLKSIRDYIGKLEAGLDISRPLEALRQERDRIAAEYADLLPVEHDRAAFRELLALARRVFPYIENHNFYVEHWHHTVFWRKMRDTGRLLSAHRFLGEADDIFFLNRFEVGQALYDLVASWAAGSPSRGERFWPDRIRHRKAVYEVLRRWSPPPALGLPPGIVTEPLTIMLWGITSERIQGWLQRPGGVGDGLELSGSPASPGVVEGPARILTSVSGIKTLLPGEILVCTCTTPGWTPAFAHVKAVVTDVGGMMSHAAIVCREYGVPSVVGTRTATKTFRNGQRLLVDGTRGVIRALES